MVFQTPIYHIFIDNDSKVMILMMLVAKADESEKGSRIDYSPSTQVHSVQIINQNQNVSVNQIINKLSFKKINNNK